MGPVPWNWKRPVKGRRGREMSPSRPRTFSLTVKSMVRFGKLMMPSPEKLIEEVAV